MDDTASKYRPQKYENKDPRPDLPFSKRSPGPWGQTELDGQQKDAEDRRALIISVAMLVIALLLWSLA